MTMPPHNRPARLLLACFIACCVFAVSATAGEWEEIAAKIGADDAIAVAGPDGTRLFARHASQPRVPASTLKILTALVAFHHLGPDYRFPTEFYRDSEKNLIIKGYGDPMLVSEHVAEIAGTLAGKVDAVHDIVIDGTYFKKPIVIPGIRSQSLQPYDAPNGAFCVNFNTVFFKTVNGTPVSAEPQTPLLPTAEKRIRAAGASQGRILLSSIKSELSRYAGELFCHFLVETGVAVRGGIRIGRVDPETDTLIYRHRSKRPLCEVVRALMKYSNNFIANQLLLAVGARVSGPPATLDKGVAAVKKYAENRLGIAPTIVEGSGISRQNRVTAEMFLKILDAFAPHHALLESDGRVYFKTGTLDGIRTRAGYIKTAGGDLYRFALLLNTRGRRAKPIVTQIADRCIRASKAKASK